MKTILKLNNFLVPVFGLTILFSQGASSDHSNVLNIKRMNDFDRTSNTYAEITLINLHFGSINIHSRKGTSDIIAGKEYDYSINLFAENSNIKNVRVIAGFVDGKIFYDKTFDYISAAAPKRIDFSHTMPIGTYTMYIEVDPENIIAELNEKDNRTTRTFTANLRI